MKLLSTLMLLTSITNAGMWSTVTSMGLKEKKVDAVYTLDTAGFNPRVYEFRSTMHKGSKSETDLMSNLN